MVYYYRLAIQKRENEDERIKENDGNSLPVAPPEKKSDHRCRIESSNDSSWATMLHKPVQWNSNNGYAERSKTIFIDKIPAMMMKKSAAVAVAATAAALLCLVHLFFQRQTAFRLQIHGDSGAAFTYACKCQSNQSTLAAAHIGAAHM